MQKEQKPSQFAHLGLHKHLLQAIEEKGFTEPTPIQKEAIPPALSGKDVIGQAQTGTGKTAVFALAILQKIMPELPVVQALVLTPTRELATQVATEVRALAKHSHASVALLYGGQDIQPQIRELRGGAQIVVGTPGRILDHLERKTLDTRNCSIVVLDEADRMLDMGFIDDVERIFRSLPPAGSRQTLLFSATVPEEIVKLANKHMRAPAVVKTSEDSLTVDTITQFFVRVDKDLKPKALAALLAQEKPEAAIVFCRTKYGADALARLLKGYGFDANAMHGNLTQNRRENVLHGFRSGQTQLMIATDVAGRGLDITGVSHVINYDLPNDARAYVHRIGRTGRAGAEGKAVTFITNLLELRDLKSTAARTDSEISEMQLNLHNAPAFSKSQVPAREESHGGRFGGRGGFHRGRDGGSGPRRGGRGGGHFGPRPHGSHSQGGYGGRPRSHSHSRHQSGRPASRDHQKQTGWHRVS